MSKDTDSSLEILLEALKGSEAGVRVEAAKKLGRLEHSSQAALRALERAAAKDRSKKVREAAIQTLRSPTYRRLQRQSSSLAPRPRRIVLGEIDRWQADALISPEQSEVLKQRYRFDVPVPAAQPVIEKPAPPAKVEAEKPLPPKRSLAQMLLSETTIKVALYLGAFFVISASMILAAVIEILRLPILLIVTTICLGVSLGLKRRLPQASFVLYVVFSFLLPIDAGVFQSIINLAPGFSHPYWILVLATLSVCWGLGTWLYQSRLFSLLAFGAASGVMWLIGRWVDASEHLDILLLTLSSLTGLGGAYVLKRWQDNRFATPLLVLVQIQQVVLLSASALIILYQVVIYDSPYQVVVYDFPLEGWWLVITFTWLLASFFYIVSNLIRPFALFPFLAVATLLPLPWFFLGTFSPEARAVMIVTWIWGAVLTIAGEGLGYLRLEAVQKYRLPLFIASAPLFVIAAIGGLFDLITIGFAYLVGTAIVYTGLTIHKPRHAPWFGTLLSVCCAYLVAFELPFLEDHSFYPGFILLWPTLILLGVDLATKYGFKASNVWHLAPRALGTLIGGINILVLLGTGAGEPSKAALAFTILSVFFTLYALVSTAPVIGYLATASLAVTVPYLLAHFEQSTWLVPMTLLFSAYYLGGLVPARLGKSSAWTNVMRVSGLALGVLVAFSAPFQGDLASVVSVALVAIWFTIEAFDRQNNGLGIPAYLFYTWAYLAAMYEFGVFEHIRWLTPLTVLVYIHYLLGFGLKLAGKQGAWVNALRVIGLLMAIVVALSAPFQGGPASIVSVTLFAVLFTVEAFDRHNVWLGFPANLLYLGAYFMVLAELEVNEPQTYSIGAALLGIIMHYLLVRSGSSTGAFITGMLSQLVLLSTTYIQMVSTARFLFFFILFFQSLLVILYGLVLRARSLVITPIIFVTLGVISVVFSALSGIPTAILIGCTGVLLLVLGILAMVLRERLIKATEKLGERLGGWRA